MASPEVSQALFELQSSSMSATDKTSSYDALLRRILNNRSSPYFTADLKLFLDAVLGESLGIVVSRQLLTSVVSALRSIDNADVVIEVGQHALELQQSRTVSFEEQDAAIREILADALESSGNHSAAAKVLQGIQLESSQRTISIDDKTRVLIRIVRNYLEEDNAVDADVYLHKAKSLWYLCQDMGLRVMYQLSRARILDAQRKFLDAAREYHALSYSHLVVEEERMRALSAAIVCAVLAPAGPQRSQALARLFKDERASRLPEYGILEKMFLDRLISPAEAESFASTLAEHQRARTADGLTVLEKAVAEHNLVGASKIYEDISFDVLAGLLGQSRENAEEFAARMIEQGRLVGRIDQIARRIYFVQKYEVMANNPEAASYGAGPSNSALDRWDSNVQNLAADVEKAWGWVATELGDFSAESVMV